MRDENLSPEISGCHTQTILENGIAIHKWWIESPRALLILQHGFGEYAERYVTSQSRLIRRLNANGFTVWAMDLPGHGSSRGDGSMINMEDVVQKHLELRQEAATLKLPVFLFGHSLGGLITIASTTYDASGVSGIVLSSPALPAQDTSILVERSLGLLAWLAPSASLPVARTPVEKLVHGLDQIQLINTDSKLYKGQMSCSSGAAALRISKEVWKSLEGWHKPTLVIHGTSDVSIGFKRSQMFVEMIASSDKTLHLDEGGYHELLCDRNADAVAQVIVRWLIGRN